MDTFLITHVQDKRDERGWNWRIKDIYVYNIKTYICIKIIFISIYLYILCIYMFTIYKQIYKHVYFYVFPL